MQRTIVIGTRGSSLSLCQTQIIQVRLEERFPDRRFTVKTINAKADQQPDVPLVAMSGEGIFVKELETALYRGEVDLAVHSMKDLPLQLPEGVCLAAVTEREDARDALVLRQAQDERPEWSRGALVSRQAQSLEELPSGARIGTSSLRRKSQLLFQRRDLEVVEIRGNVDTRLRKLDEGRYDAVVLAACGLIRLGLEDRLTQYLSFEQMLPEPGQGALGIEAREDDEEIRGMLQFLDDSVTRRCVDAERAFLDALGGGCRVPIAAYAQATSGTLTLEGAVIAPDGSRRLRDQTAGPLDAPAELGQTLADCLLEQGAKALLTMRP